ncbi:MAG: hypothetical protein M3304_01735 [Actinomycetota bacterium]|nr:hypothetical protein [Actinomycetota bacterium]
MTRAARIAVVYYSATGNVHRLARYAALIGAAPGAHTFHVRRPTPQRFGATALVGGVR